MLVGESQTYRHHQPLPVQDVGFVDNYVSEYLGVAVSDLL